VLGVDQISSFDLAEGATGTAQTLDHMAALVRRDATNLQIRGKALEIIAGCACHDFTCEIQALYNFVKNEIVYRRDPFHAEWVQDAPRTLFVFGTGDCDCKVVCLATLLASVGHKCRFKVIGLKPHSYKHVYLQVKTSDGWISLDPTPEAAHPGWEGRGHTAVYEIFPDGAGAPSPVCLIGLGLVLWGLWKLAK